jgi:hypothetical protein
MERSSKPPRQMRMVPLLLVAAGTIFTGTPARSADTEKPSPPQIDVGEAASATESRRFEGYIFLDADGRPLPFQSDIEIEERLRTATVVSKTKIPVGVSRPKKMLMESGARRFNAVFKFIEETKQKVRDPTATGRGKFYLHWRDSYVFDVAAYRVDRLLGMDRIPPIVFRKIKGSDGSLQIWLEGTITENDRRERAIDPPETARFNQQRSTIRLFDNLVANRDSNLGNTLIDGNWRLWFIDCSRCFGSSPDLLYPEMVTHCERRLWRALKELDRRAAEEALSSILAGIEIDALFARRDKLVELIQARIDEWGEDLVLFDQRPPTETAPWIGE